MQAAFELFTRSTFGLEPGCRVGAQLKSLGSYTVLSKGSEAKLDRTRDQVIFLARGATKLSALASGNRQQIVAFHFGGDIVTVPADGHYGFNLKSLVDTDLLAFPAREFFDRAAADAATARPVIDRLSTALHRSREKSVALGQKTALERLAGFLFSMSERVGRIEGNVCLLDLPMSRRDIGDSLGLTIETVSRQFGALRDAGVIATKGRNRVALLNVEYLKNRAGFSRNSWDSSGQSGKFDLDQSVMSAPELGQSDIGGF